MENENIRSTILEVIAMIAPETDVRAIRPDQPLRRQVELDSMDWLNVMVGLRERLGIEIPEADYGRLSTLDAMVAYIAARPPGSDQQRSPARTGTTTPLPCTRHLVDDATVTVRPMRADDMPLEADFVRHLSAEARYERFMVTVRELSPAKLKYLTDVDQIRHVALVATVERDSRQEIVGVARYIVDPSQNKCEFAIAIDDDWHGSGLAGMLMHDLMEIARSRGVGTMEGIVLATNTRMLQFARQLGFRSQRNLEDRDTVRVARTL